MSDSEEEVFGFYGRPLEQFDEDAFPKKRPISVEEQIATDTQGRRRFHGAFTGGFSAGFFNTVGSVEGWRPTEFKSSRSEKAGNSIRKPEDYMDDEDVGEFGIAPQNIRATNDYNTSKKRKRKVFSDGPIPGDPVLHTLIQSSTETIGYLLLRNMGLKHDDPEEEEEEDAGQKIYGCEMPKTYEIKKSIKKHSYKVPQIYLNALANPKANTFGISYTGLDKSHVNLFAPTNLVVKERNNKKLSIAGQAFGVGAFEEEDEDIYVKDDMSRYDFEMTAEKKKAASKPVNNLIFGLFVPSKISLAPSETFLPPTIPHSFTGKHKVKKSRFAPIAEEEAPKRHEIDATTRAKYLGETSDKSFTASKPIESKNKPPMVSKNKSVDRNNDEVVDERKVKTEKIKAELNAGLIFDRFVSASKTEEHLDILEPVQASETEHGTKDMRDAAKMKMFGTLTRATDSWMPHTLVCKRFNIPETHVNELETKNRSRKRNLIFQNEERADVITITKSGLQQMKTDAVINLDVVEESNVEEASTSESTNGTIIVPEDKILEPQSVEPIPEPIKLLDITDKVDVSKNTDLFKAIFMDSDESEDETAVEDTANEEQTQREQEIKEQILSQDMLLPKIKPMKEGILSNVSFIKFTPPAKQRKEVAEVDSYGPKLPEVVEKAPANVTVNEVNSEEEWIEKGEKRKEHKHRKKHKKEKSKKKHKKDKYK